MCQGCRLTDHPASRHSSGQPCGKTLVTLEAKDAPLKSAERMRARSRCWRESSRPSWPARISKACPLISLATTRSKGKFSSQRWMSELDSTPFSGTMSVVCNMGSRSLQITYMAASGITTIDLSNDVKHPLLEMVDLDWSWQSAKDLLKRKVAVFVLNTILHCTQQGIVPDFAQVERFACYMTGEWRDKAPLREVTEVDLDVLGKKMFINICTLSAITEAGLDAAFLLRTYARLSVSVGAGAGSLHGTVQHHGQASATLLELRSLGIAREPKLAMPALEAMLSEVREPGGIIILYSGLAACLGKIHGQAASEMSLAC